MEASFKISLSLGLVDTLSSLLKSARAVAKLSDSMVFLFESAVQHGFDRILNILFAQNLSNRITKAQCDSLVPTAARVGHLTCFRLLLDHGHDLDSKNCSGLSALQIASEEGHWLVVQDLLERKRKKMLESDYAPLDLSLSGHGNGAKLPIHLASGRGHIKVLEAILKWMSDMGSLLNIKESDPPTGLRDNVFAFVSELQTDKFALNSNGLNALHIAASGGHWQLIPTLLSYGFDKDANTRDNQKAVHLASLSGSLAALKLLFEQGAVAGAVDDNGDTCLHVAAREGIPAIIKLLSKQNGIDLNVFNGLGYDALSEAVRAKHLEAVKELLDQYRLMPSYDDSDKTENPLSLAIKSDSTEIIEFLVARGINLNAKDMNGEAPLHVATNRRMHRTMQLLLDKICSRDLQDSDGRTALLLAVKSGDIWALEILLKAGGNPMIQDGCKIGPLHEAIKGELEPFVKMILSLGGDMLNLDALYGVAPRETALHAAAQLPVSCRPSMTKLLLDAGANRNTKDSEGKTPLILAYATDSNESTPLHYAVLVPSLGVVKELLRNKARGNIQRNDGRTPLHLAVIGKDIEIVQELLSSIQPEDMWVLDNDGMSPVAMACLFRREDVVEELLAAGHSREGLSPTDPENNEVPLIMASTIGGNTRIVEKLHKYHNASLDVMFNSVTPILTAAIQRPLISLGLVDMESEHFPGSEATLELIQYLVNHGPDINKAEGSALLAAVAAARLDIVEFLLNKGADPNLYPEGGESPLRLACRHGMTEIAKALLANGKIRLNEQQISDASTETTLNLAINSGNPILVEKLLEHEAINPNEKGLRGVLPLFNATKHGPQMLRALLNCPRLDVNLRDHRERTALVYCLTKPSAADRAVDMMVEVLLPQTNVSLPDIRDHTALYYATGIHQDGIFKAVLDEFIGRNLGDIDAHLSAAVHAAVAHAGYPARVKMLIDAGAHLHYRDKNGWSAKDVAKSLKILETELGDTESLWAQIDPAGFQEPHYYPGPSAWDTADLHLDLKIASTTKDEVPTNTNFYVKQSNTSTWVGARANFCFPPTGTSYFEFKISEETDRLSRRKTVAIGVYQEDTDLDNLLGFPAGSIGYHSDDGAIYRETRGVGYLQMFGPGDTIGCRYDPEEASICFMINDQAQEIYYQHSLKGQVYPALCFDRSVGDLVVHTNFGGKQAPFVLNPDRKPSETDGAMHLRSDSLFHSINRDDDPFSLWMRMRSSRRRRR
ncbi:ankyrin repeat-containing domain protein [Cladorrhinum sp. PSN332]|nr:ankyrin repeat-containing domain protein [Cladorrhinum sp. PSN332]